MGFWEWHNHEVNNYDPGGLYSRQTFNEMKDARENFLDIYEENMEGFNNAVASVGFGVSLGLCGNPGQFAIIREMGLDAYQDAVDDASDSDDPESAIEDSLVSACSHPEAVEVILNKAAQLMGQMIGESDENTFDSDFDIDWEGADAFDELEARVRQSEEFESESRRLRNSTWEESMEEWKGRMGEAEAEMRGARRGSADDPFEEGFGRRLGRFAEFGEFEAGAGLAEAEEVMTIAEVGELDILEEMGGVLGAIIAGIILASLFTDAISSSDEDEWGGYESSWF